jgi:hypothetical protein
MVRRGTLLAVLVLGLMLAPARADDFFGVSVNRVFDDNPHQPLSWEAPLAALEASGIRVARTDAFWSWVEPVAPKGGKHTYDWTTLDWIALALARHHLRWLPVLDYSALWAASGADYHSPPTSNDDYAAYAKAFAVRYGRGGSFWTRHADVQPLPVLTYEIWNEPNGAWFWSPAPDAAAYADMYLRAREAIHAVDPEAIAMVGGLVPDTGYVAAMYAARPELRGQVDALGLHPYAPTADGVIANVRAFRSALENLGDPSVPIDVTELGWPTSGSGSGIVVPEQARAAALASASDSLARSDCGVAAVVSYTWTTPEQNPADIEDWYGIRHHDGSATPSSDAYQGVVARWAADPVTDATRLHLCHPDADGDGIPDAVDACPNRSDLGAERTPRDGCPVDPPPPPPDFDGDGMPDAFDACPAVSDVVAPRTPRDGCPAPPTCTIAPGGSRVVLRRMRLTAACNQAAETQLRGVVTAFTPKPRGRLRTNTFRISPVSGSVRVSQPLSLAADLPRAALVALERRARVSVSFTLTATSSSGTSTATATIARLTLRSSRR